MERFYGFAFFFVSSVYVWNSRIWRTYYMLCYISRVIYRAWSVIWTGYYFRCSSERLNQWRHCRTKPAVQGRSRQGLDYTAFNKTLQLSQWRGHCLNCQLWAFSRKSYNLEYPINAKKVISLYKIIYLLNLDKNKNDLVVEKRQTDHVFCVQVFFTEMVVAKPKVDIVLA